MTALRLLAATMLALVANQAATATVGAETPDVCEEAEGALTFGMYDVAVSTLTRCLEIEGLDRNDRVKAHANRGHAHFARENHDDAIADYARALELGGNDVELLIKIARSHYYEYRSDDALGFLDRAPRPGPGEHRGALLPWPRVTR